MTESMFLSQFKDYIIPKAQLGRINGGTEWHCACQGPGSYGSSGCWYYPGTSNQPGNYVMPDWGDVQNDRDTYCGSGSFCGWGSWVCGSMT